MTDLEQIKDLITKRAKSNGLQITKNLDAIAKAKLNMFGVEEWYKCPCHNDGFHACIGGSCRKELDEKGVCGCNLYKK